MLNWLVKINFLSSLANSYQVVCLNFDVDVPMAKFLQRFHRSNGQQFENLMLFITKLVRSIKQTIEVFYFPRLQH